MAQRHHSQVCCMEQKQKFTYHIYILYITFINLIITIQSNTVPCGCHHTAHGQVSAAQSQGGALPPPAGSLWNGLFLCWCGPTTAWFWPCDPAASPAGSEEQKPGGVLCLSSKIWHWNERGGRDTWLYNGAGKADITQITSLTKKMRVCSIDCKANQEPVWRLCAPCSTVSSPVRYSGFLPPLNDIQVSWWLTCMSSAGDIQGIALREWMCSNPSVGPTFQFFKLYAILKWRFGEEGGSIIKNIIFSH